MTSRLDFYFFVGSTYSYLSVARAAAAAASAGVTLDWKPFSVRTLMREQNNSPFAGKPVKLRYMWRDIERRAQRFAIPYNGAPQYPIDADERANQVATLASMEGWCPAFVQAAYASWFMEKLDPGTPETLHKILSDLGRDADACLSRAAQPDVLALYQQRTDTARDLGIFGSPSYVSGSEVFWGDDRLEDALAWCAANGG